MFFTFFLELFFMLQKRIIFVKGKRNPNAKLLYTTEGLEQQPILHMALSKYLEGNNETLLKVKSIIKTS